MTRYEAGRRLEYLARDVLEAQGYTVIRSAGSKGAIDLVGIGPRDVLCVQVKAAGQPIVPALQELAGLPSPANVRREVWVRDGRAGCAGWQVTRVPAVTHDTPDDMPDLVRDFWQSLTPTGYRAACPMCSAPDLEARSVVDRGQLWLYILHCGSVQPLGAPGRV